MKYDTELITVNAYNAYNVKEAQSERMVSVL